MTRVRVLEFGSVGPVPFASMLLADMGADVVHVARPQSTRDSRNDPTLRGRRMIRLDLKRSQDAEQALSLASRADILLEGNRPGVMERLGLGPDVCLLRRPQLVYGRMTGWGQTGPLAKTAGHDINYIALTGALHAIGPAGGAPLPPLNLVGDYAGGSMFLLFGVLSAYIEAQFSGRGQVVDAAMVDGASILMTLFYGMQARGEWQLKRGTNSLDGGVPWYSTYETADKHHVAVGALEQPFWDQLLTELDLGADAMPSRDDPANWPAIRSRLEQVFRSKPRDEWARRFAMSDACVTPVIDINEMSENAHMTARNVQTSIGGLLQPAPAPRLDRTPGRACPSLEVAGGAAEVFADWSSRDVAADEAWQ